MKGHDQHEARSVTIDVIRELMRLQKGQVQFLLWHLPKVRKKRGECRLLR